MTMQTRPGLPRSIAGAIVFAGLLAPVSAAAPAPPTVDLAGKLTRIQTTCFDLYPEKLIRRMSGRPGPVPDDVKADPRKEVAYLKTEEKVAKGLFYPSILEDILPAFAAVIRPGMRFLDLGSGDGRIVFMAALLGAKATGIEYDAELHRIAFEARRRLGDLVDPERAVLIRGDFFKQDLRPYDVFFYFALGSSSEDRLLAKLRGEMGDSAVLILAYPSGSVPGFRKTADYAGVAVFESVRTPSGP
ncbi:MAG TPA: hypothetical protein VJ144_03920 [Candidatus Polarisedimenticolia bacterium]|nr:hypothetical protein [Candidatus Polarisedimenticolia bacterium]